MAELKRKEFRLPSGLVVMKREPSGMDTILAAREMAKEPDQSMVALVQPWAHIALTIERLGEKTGATYTDLLQLPERDLNLLLYVHKMQSEPGPSEIAALTAQFRPGTEAHQALLEALRLASTDVCTWPEAMKMPAKERKALLHAVTVAFGLDKEEKEE